MHRRYISIEPGNFPRQVRGRRKIDLITLNVKLTLSGEEGGGGESRGFGIDVQEKMRKSQ